MAFGAGWLVDGDPCLVSSLAFQNKLPMPMRQMFDICLFPNKMPMPMPMRKMFGICLFPLSTLVETNCNGLID